MTPKSSSSDYLSKASKAVYDAMMAADPMAVWLMQAWLFQDTAFWKPDQVKAYLDGRKLGC